MEQLQQRLMGTGVALVTPFTPDGQQVDYTALGRLLEHVAPHVDYLVVNGTTAEAPTVKKEDKKKILAFVKANNPHRKPIVFGMGGNDTIDLLSYSEFHDLQGVDALLSVCPYYNKPNQEGLYRHFMTLADHYPKPIILYNVPPRTSSDLAPETVLRLAQHPNIIGIKEASGSITRSVAIANKMPSNFLLLSGDDLFAVPVIAVGGHGVISVIANAYPEQYSQSVRAALNGDLPKAQQLLHQLFDINQAIFEEGNPTGVKQLLEILGICSGSVRLPLVGASEQLQLRLRELAGKIGPVWV